MFSSPLPRFEGEGQGSGLPTFSELFRTRTRTQSRRAGTVLVLAEFVVLRVRVPSCGLSTSTKSLGRILFLQLDSWVNLRVRGGFSARVSPLHRQKNVPPSWRFTLIPETARAVYGNSGSDGVKPKTAQGSESDDKSSHSRSMDSGWKAKPRRLDCLCCPARLTGSGKCPQRLFGYSRVV
jgi:hypothetical protein